MLTYLLYEASDEAAYIENVKGEIEQEFELINKKSYYFIKKSVRKILRNTKKYIRYSKKKETEVELLIYFCSVLKKMSPSIEKNVALHNIYKRQVEAIKKTVSSLHEDLQYDYEIELNEIDNDLWFAIVQCMHWWFTVPGVRNWWKNLLIGGYT